MMVDSEVNLFFNYFIEGLSVLSNDGLFYLPTANILFSCLEAGLLCQFIEDMKNIISPR